MRLNIKLGEKVPEPVTISSGPEPRMYYPELRLTTDEPIDLPKEGTLVVRFKKVASSERNGKYSCDLEIHEVVSAKADEDESPAKRYTEAEDSLDALMKEHESKKKE